jgi:hypothetical protein
MIATGPAPWANLPERPSDLAQGIREAGDRTLRLRTNSLFIAAIPGAGLFVWLLSGWHLGLVSEAQWLIAAVSGNALLVPAALIALRIASAHRRREEARLRARLAELPRDEAMGVLRRLALVGSYDAQEISGTLLREARRGHVGPTGTLPIPAAGAPRDPRTLPLPAEGSPAELA